MSLLSFEAKDLPNERQQALADWLRLVGVDPADVCCGEIAVTTTGYDLRLTVYARNAAGAMYVDEVTSSPLTRRQIVQLGPTADWPGAEVASGDQPGDAAHRP